MACTICAKSIRNQKSVKNTPQTLPRRCKGSPRLSQDPPKTPKMAPRHLQDALRRSKKHPKHATDIPKRRQDCPRHTRTPQRRAQDLSKARFLKVREKPKMNMRSMFPSINRFKSPSIQMGTAECAERLNPPPPEGLACVSDVLLTSSSHSSPFILQLTLDTDA